jgi:hypothetical protein
MLIVKNIRVQSFSLKFLQISWEIDPTAEDIYSYKFDVYRSESEEGGYDQLNQTPLVDEYDFRDIQVNLLAKEKDVYYIIRATNTLNNEYKEYGPVKYTPEQDLIAEEISRRHILTLRQFTGRKCLIYRVRTFGTRCGCFDPILGKITKASCETCYSTGWVKGYLRPMQVYINITAPSRDLLETMMGDSEPIQGEGFLANYPVLKPRDVIIENENKRWRVQKVITSQKFRSLISQRIALSQLVPSDIEFRLPVNLEDYVDYPAEERNWTNQQTL